MEKLSMRREWRRDQYTMEGVRNMGGAAVDGEGKSAKRRRVYRGGRWSTKSQGAMAGSAIAAGVSVPAVATSLTLDG